MFTLLLGVMFLGSITAQQTVLFHEEFDGSLGDWTTQAFPTDVPTDPPYDSTTFEDAVWTWDSDGYPDSDYRATTLESETVANGVAMYDAVGYLFEEWPADDLPTTPDNYYPGLHSELISPEIEVGGAEKLRIRWTQVIAELTSYYDATEGTPRVGYSVKFDDGDWSETEELPGLVTNGAEFTEDLEFFIPNTEGAENLQVKLIYNMNFYYWIVDDFKVIRDDADFSRLKTSNAFATPLHYAQQRDAIEEDTFFFSFDIFQEGNLNAGDITARVDVVNADTEELIERIEESVGDSLDPLSGNASMTAGLNTNYVPAGLDAGNYRVEYYAYPTDSGFTAPEEVFFLPFAVADSSWSPDNGEVNGTGFYSRQTGDETARMDWSAAFRLPENISGDYYWDETYFSYSLRDPDVPANENAVFTLYYSRFLGNSINDFSQTGGPVDVDEQFEVIGSNFYFLSDFEPTEKIFINLGDMPSLSSPTDSLSAAERYITPGDYYYFWVSTSGANNTDVEIGTSIPYPNILYSPGSSIAKHAFFHGPSGNYYTGWIDDDNVPAIGASITAVIDVSIDSRLPENSLKVYPNPATDMITADINLNNATDVTVLITDMQGKVKSLSVEEGVSSTRVERNIGHLPAGAYIFRIATPKGAKNVKFIKQ